MKNYFKTLVIMFLFIMTIGSGSKAFALVTWNPNDKSSDSIKLSNNNLTAKIDTTVGGTPINVRSNKYITSGKRYCELKIDSINIINSGTILWGVANNNYNINSDNANSTNQLSYCNLYTIYPSQLKYGVSYKDNDIISMAIDIDNKKIKFANNGVWNKEITLPTWDKYYLYLSTISSHNDNISTINCGATPFVYTPPEGYSPFDNEIVSSISLNKNSASINVGQSDNLIATTTPAGAEVVWSSSDSTIATVDATGKVTAVKEGQATIAAQIKGSETKATCTVTVSKSGTTTPTEPTNPTEPTGDGNLFIEMVDGNVKQAQNVDVADFIKWFKNRDLDHTDNPIYKIKNAKGNVEYLVHDKVVGFEIR